MVDKYRYNSNSWENFLSEAQKRSDDKYKLSTLGDDSEDLYETYKKSFKEEMRAYENVNSALLDKSYKKFKNAENTDFNQRYIYMYDKDLKIALSQCKVLILTANPIEKAVFHFCITEQTKEKIRRFRYKELFVYVLKWGRYWVAHIPQLETGANKDHGSNKTLQRVLEVFSPNIVISLGVAFGIDNKTQNIGDVIVSKRLFPYSENKRDEDKIKPDRNQDKTIDDWLHASLVNTIGFLDDVTYGSVLSGGSVMSSFEEKDKVCLGYTKNDFIVGGEMEGTALFQIAKTEGIPCAIIKGICDWGVAKNDIFPEDRAKEEVFKDSLQAYAMEEAFEKCMPLLMDKTLFNEPKFNSFHVLEKQFLIAKKCMQFILFMTIAFGLYFSFLHIYLVDTIIFASLSYISIGVLLIAFAIIMLIINSNLPQKLIWFINRYYARYRMNKEIKMYNNGDEVAANQD